MRSLAMFLLIIGSLACFASVRADEAEALDLSLLEDLGAELIEDADEADRSALDQGLLEELGEDVGLVKNSKDPGLAKVIASMKAAQDRLERVERTLLKQEMDASVAQGEALIGLETMIAEITKRKSQCQGGNCKQPADPKPGNKDNPNGKAGNKAAKSATGSTSSDADLSTDLEAAGQLVKDLWGKLPERQRQQILQPLSEEFLPKYADEIEAYFHALALPKRIPAESP